MVLCPGEPGKAREEEDEECEDECHEGVVRLRREGVCKGRKLHGCVAVRLRCEGVCKERKLHDGWGTKSENPVPNYPITNYLISLYP